MRSRLGLSFLVIAFFTSPLYAAPSSELVVSGLTKPLYVTYAPNDPNRLFVVEQGGAIKIVDLTNDSVLPTPFLTVGSINASGFEQGVLGLAFDPNYNTNGYFYVSLTNPIGVGDTAIRRYKVQGDPKTSNVAGNAFTPILNIEQPTNVHNTHWLQFGPDGNLYIGAGDGGGNDDPDDNGQNPYTLLGTILRITPTANGSYTVPNDNPFAPGGTNPGGGAEEVWAYGLRNPWRNSFDRKTGDLYIADVGQNLIEEINFQPASSTGGENYGWRIREGGDDNPNTDGTLLPVDRVDPIYSYHHGPGDQQGNSVTGGYVYRGPVQELDGRYFFADFINPRIRTLDTTNNVPRFEYNDVTNLFNPGEALFNQISSFGEDLYANLYIVSLAGSIYRVTGDVPHDTENDPFLPTTMTGNVASFTGMPGDGRWFDPALNDMYSFATDGSSHFIQIGLPSLGTIPDADGFYTVTSSLGTVQVAAGAFYSFASPVSQFSISGINPSVDGDNPLAFPVFLAFDAFSNNFTMTGHLAPVPVPEPTSVGLLLLVIPALLWRRRQNTAG